MIHWTIIWNRWIYLLLWVSLHGIRNLPQESFWSLLVGTISDGGFFSSLTTTIFFSPKTLVSASNVTASSNWLPLWLWLSLRLRHASPALPVSPTHFLVTPCTLKFKVILVFWIFFFFDIDWYYSFAHRNILGRIFRTTHRWRFCFVTRIHVIAHLCNQEY